MDILKDYEENYGNGWVKLFRSLSRKGWYKKSDYIHLWIHLLLKVNYKENEWLYKNKIFKVKEGQFITSRKTLSMETGINESKIERILKCFENEQQIEQQNMHTSRLISIINWQQYQIKEQQIEQQVNSKRTASEQRVNTIKESKKDKNIIDRQNEFEKELLNYKDKYPIDMLKAFYRYWSEPDKKGVKMRKEMEKTWSTTGRLATWKNNSLNYRK